MRVGKAFPASNPLHVLVRLIDELAGGLFVGHPGNPPGDYRGSRTKRPGVGGMFRNSGGNRLPSRGCPISRRG